MNKFSIIIVVYNKLIADTSIYKCLCSIEFKNYSLIVFDNSDIDFIKKNKAFCKSNNIEYFSLGYNVGLSKAYNYVLDNAHINDYIILFDDDTKINSDYFDKLNIVIDSERAEIYAPIAMDCNKKIISPNTFRFFRKKFIKNINSNINQKCFNAINSGLVINKNVFINYRYDERLFLDLVDEKFCYDQRKIGCTFLKFYSILYQNFHQNNCTCFDEYVANRLKIRINDIITFGKIVENGKYRLQSILKVFYLIFYYFIKYRSLSIFTCFHF